MKFHVERTSDAFNTPMMEMSFDTLDELLAWVTKEQDNTEGWFNGVILRYEKNLKWEGWNLEVYDDYKE